LKSMFLKPFVVACLCSMGACQNNGENTKANNGASRTNASEDPRPVPQLATSCGSIEADKLNGNAKNIKDVMPAPSPHWVGDGFYVYPVFNDLAFTKHVSPFLMFDYGAPKEFQPTSKRLGVGKHPHRGMETVTIAWQGEVEHGDSVGNKGVIGPGEVQWMTAGRGIVHEEYHSRRIAKAGGTLEMCQLWVNLPKKHKMAPPGYQPILKEDIPQVPLTPDDPEMAHGYVRIIAGAFSTAAGPAKTFTPINLWDMLLIAPGRPVAINIPSGHNTLIFVRQGSLKVGSSDHVGPQGMVRLETDGSLVTLEAKEANTQLLFMGGEPIDEPIASGGPFVMNTQAELAQAREDYRNGKFAS